MAEIKKLFPKKKRPTKTPETVMIIIPAGERVMTSDYYQLYVKEPVQVELPLDHLEPIDD
jgi:hypothetical protein